MSSLIKSAKLSKLCLKNNAIFFTAVRHHWNKDFKPGPYPRTEEERLKAAEKYGIHPSEYKAIPDDGAGAGDYPDLPLISAEARDPHYPYDNPELKRNFNEPMHDDFDLVREDRYDVNAKFRLPTWMFWAQFIGMITVSFSIYYLLEPVKMFHAVTPRQYPTDGKKHYTFEQE